MRPLGVVEKGGKLRAGMAGKADGFGCHDDPPCLWQAGWTPGGAVASPAAADHGIASGSRQPPVSAGSNG